MRVYLSLCCFFFLRCQRYGHGPFSHLFDQMFIPRVRGANNQNWTHEAASIAMFDHMVEVNHLRQEMEFYDLDDADLTFIRELINPPNNDGAAGQWNNNGRPEEKSFLYEIVANHHNEIDVDKFDYLARDCHHMGLPNNFDSRRFIINARVCMVEERRHICSRDKDVANLYDMFHARYCVHRKACQHKVTQSVQLMIVDALLEADQHIHFTGSDENPLTISQAKDDMVAYMHLTDEVLQRIQREANLEAKRILENIHKRKLYMLVGEAKRAHQEEPIEEETRQSLTDALLPVVPRREIGILEFNFDYAMNTRDPISHTYFYSKRNPEVGFRFPKEQRSNLVPATFCEWIIRVFWKNTRNDYRPQLQELRRCFTNWCRNNGFTVIETPEGAGPVRLSN